MFSIFQDTVREIKKINEFLKCNRSDELIQDIAKACSFANLKKADQNKSHALPVPTDTMYRKGNFTCQYMYIHTVHVYVCVYVEWNKRSQSFVVHSTGPY